MRRDYWLDAVVVVAVLSALLAIGCGPVPDCDTPGGLGVKHAECSTELAAMQQRIEASAERLGFRPHLLDGAYVLAHRTGLDEHGGFQAYGISVRGQTYCSTWSLEIAVAGDESWNTTALAHEAFHLAQGCIMDLDLQRECLDRGDPPAACYSVATHPRWTELGITAAIRDINGAP